MSRFPLCISIGATRESPVLYSYQLRSKSHACQACHARAISHRYTSGCCLCVMTICTADEAAPFEMYTYNYARMYTRIDHEDYCSRQKKKQERESARHGCLSMTCQRPGEEQLRTHKMEENERSASKRRFERSNGREEIKKVRGYRRQRLLLGGNQVGGKVEKRPERQREKVRKK